MFNIKIFVIAFLFVAIIPFSLYAINKVYLGNVDGTAPTILAVPETGSLLTTSGVNWSTEGDSFYGTGLAGTYKSTDSGLTWTLQSTAATNGVQSVTGSTLLALGAANVWGTSRMLRSIDGGINWTMVYNRGFNAGDTQRRSIIKNETDGRWWAAYGKQANSDVIYSDNDGISWTVSDNNANFCGNGATGIAANGTIIIVGTGVQDIPACDEAIRVSTNNGSSWSNVTPNCTPPAGEINYSSPIFVNNTFYVSVMGNGGQGCILSSTNGITWTEFSNMPFTGVYSLIFGSLGSFYDNVNYYLYLAIQDVSDAYILKVWRTPVILPAWTMIYNTNINANPGNMLTAADNRIYFGTSNERFYRLE